MPISHPEFQIDFSKIETPDDWKRYSLKNLMCSGVYEPIQIITPYYFNQICELFETKAGVKLFAYN